MKTKTEEMHAAIEEPCQREDRTRRDERRAKKAAQQAMTLELCVATQRYEKKRYRSRETGDWRYTGRETVRETKTGTRMTKDRETQLAFQALAAVMWPLPHATLMSFSVFPRLSVDDYSSLFHIPLMQDKGTEVLPGVEQLLPHPLR